jgi:hypothetical protein
MHHTYHTIERASLSGGPCPARVEIERRNLESDSYYSHVEEIITLIVSFGYTFQLGTMARKAIVQIFLSTVSRQIHVRNQ